MLVEWAEKFREFLDMELQVPAGALSNQPWKTLIFPKYQGLIARPLDPLAPAAGLEPAVARWGVVPWFHKGPAKDWKASTNNARSEKLGERMWTDIAIGSPGHPPKRCIIPASSFVEYTGPKGSMTKHRITRADGSPLFLAGLWARHEWQDEVTESYTMVMQDSRPGDDMERFHNRQPVFLDADGARTWLDLEADYRPVLRSPPAGTLAFDPPEPVTA